MTRAGLLLRTFIAEHGLAALVAEALGVAAVFALIGLAFAFPAAVAVPAQPLPATDGSGMGARP